jgi:hypothetical protein
MASRAAVDERLGCRILQEPPDHCLPKLVVPSGQGCLHFWVPDMALHFQELLGKRLISMIRGGRSFGADHRGVSHPPLGVSHQVFTVAPDILE